MAYIYLDTVVYIGVCLYIFSFRGSDAKTFEVCMTESRHSLSYSCGSGERIHVVSILYQEASVSCLSTPGGCQLLLETSSDGLTTKCNGYPDTCYDSIYDLYFKNACMNKNSSIATVTYECVSEKSIGMCQEPAYRTTDVAYLHSPRYPRDSDTGIVDVTDICMCEITGSQLSVEILDLIFLIDLNVRANLTLIGDSTSWTTSPTVYNIYNVNVLNNTDTISLSFNTKGQISQDAWIRITGTGEITVQCNSAAFITTTTTTKTAPTTTTTTTATEVATTSSIHVTCTGLTRDLDASNQRSSTIIGILSGIVIIQGVAIIALILYFKCVQPRRQLKPPSTESNHVYYNINTNTGSQELPPRPYAENRTNAIERTSQEHTQQAGVENQTNATERTSQELGPQQSGVENRANVYARISPYQNTDNVYTGLNSDRITQGEDTMSS